MRLLMGADLEYSADPAEYVPRATDTALADVRAGLARRCGHLRGTESWHDHDGHWLKVTVTLDDHPGLVVDDARVLLRAAGPDKGPELSGMIYGTGLVERLDTELHRPSTAEGLITF